VPLQHPNFNKTNPVQHISGSPSIVITAGPPPPKQDGTAQRMQLMVPEEMGGSSQGGILGTNSAFRAAQPQNQGLYSSNQGQSSFPAQHASQLSAESAILAAKRSPQPGKQKNVLVN